MASNAILFSYCSTLNVGCPVWTDPERTTAAPNGIYSSFNYLTQGSNYITVSNGLVSSINNICPIGPGSVLATTSGYGTGIIEASRGENSTGFNPFYTLGRDWIDIKSNSTGSYIVAIRNLVIPEGGGKVELSTDSGATFNNISNGISGTHNPTCLAMSQNGYYVVVGTSAYIYHNIQPLPAGDNFRASTSAGIRNWKGVAMNTSGTLMVAIAADGTVWRSSLSQISASNSWTQSNTGTSGISWTSITMNASGSVIWIAGNNSHLYLSTDSGATFAQVPITINVPGIGNISSPFNFSNIATDNLGNNTVATIEPGAAYGNISFIIKNFIGGAVNYNNWSWSWGYTGIYPNNNNVNGSWTGLAVSSNAATIYAANNDSVRGAMYVSGDNGASFYAVTNVRPYSSVTYVRNASCPANGTLLEQFCDGSTWNRVYADGSCGTYTTVEYNSPNCQVCSTYSVSDYGYVSYTDCSGNSQYIYFQPGDTFCAYSMNFGPAYLYSSGCTGPGPGGGGFA
jgi:hypothetical protein